MTAPDTQPAPASGEGEALREGDVALLEGLRDVLATCTCTPFPQGTGPEIDCPMHGRADYVAEALVRSPEVARLVAERDEAREKVRRVETYLGLIEKIHRVYAGIVMDTDEDRDLHARHVETADKALKLARAALGGEQAGDGGGLG